MTYKIDIDISQQRIYLKQNDNLIKSYPISSSKYGEGSTENSNMTPLGLHVIKEKIGTNVPINTLFISRINTKRTVNIENSRNKTKDDHITSRILWLDGLEEGKNKGKGVDSYSRYIYIHGTHEEGLIGEKASHGCIRMLNIDVIDLYNYVNIGTEVYISV
jgi:lipoprotein-anchoring transpeptidase ErfK/SrfK